MDLIVEIAVALVLGAIILTLLLLGERRKGDDFYRKIPAAPMVPLLGNALDFSSTSQLLKTLQRFTKEYGEIVKLQIGPFRRFILVSDYKFLECVLSSTKLLKKSHDYHFMEPWLGNALLTSTGTTWKKQRRILTPAFHFQILEHFVEVFESCGSLLLDKLSQEIDKNSVDIYPLVTLCSLDIICESIMGVSVNAQVDNDSDYVQSVKNMCRIIMDRSISPVEMYDFLFPLTWNYYTQRKALNILHSHTNSVIEKRKESRKTEKSTNRKPFLDILLDVRIDDKPLTQEEIREQVDTFMFEGHDTTASAISFALYMLANHPDVQAKVFEEQQQIFGDTQNITATYADLQEMKYLELVIKEVLRLYPSVAVFGREINEEVEFDNTLLPIGDTIVVNVFGLHRNPKYFENPLEFNPSRFETIDGTQPYAYIPFSAGPRNCIGQKFAMFEIKSVLSKILRKFELQTSIPRHECELISALILKSDNGIKIGYKLR